MKPIHINIGSIFARPHESDYAMVRRCLIANPGISYSAINALLRQRNNKRELFVDRIRALQPSSYDVKRGDFPSGWKTYHRQCPQCAKQLYHTDIYALQWLERCPIHKCQFTKTCSVCHLPWPDMDEIAKRDCPGCGIATLSDYTKSELTEIRNQNYQSIVDIYELINHHHDNNHWMLMGLSNSEGEWWSDCWSDWWNNTQITDIEFPSFQLHHHPELTQDRLNSLYITTIKLNCKSAKVSEYCGIRSVERIDLPAWNDEASNDIFKKMPHLLRNDYQVMHHIASWIQHRTPHNHQLHISTYRYLNVGDFVKGPNPCPYCLSVSLWFFHVSSKHYGNNIANRINDYPFCSLNGINNFYDGCEPSIVTNFYDFFETSHYYTVNDDDFVTWFYRRGLEVAFVDILRFVLDMFGKLQGYRESGLYFTPSPYDGRSFSDQYCAVEIKNRLLLFYYENEHPLDKYKPAGIPDIKKLCCTYDEHHEKNKRDHNPVRFDEIKETGLTKRCFKSLHDSFRYYIRHIYRLY